MDRRGFLYIFARSCRWIKIGQSLGCFSFGQALSGAFSRRHNGRTKFSFAAGVGGGGVVSPYSSCFVLAAVAAETDFPRVWWGVTAVARSHPSSFTGLNSCNLRFLVSLSSFQTWKGRSPGGRHTRDASIGLCELYVGSCSCSCSWLSCLLIYLAPADTKYSFGALLVDNND